MMMKQIARMLYGINSISCIFIGTLHTLAHYSDLTTDYLQNTLNHTIIVTGISSNVWDLWQGMSWMMGYLLIIIGLLHLFILQQTPKMATPPIGASLIMIIMLIGVIYCGVYFFSSWQVYGGSIGIGLQLLCLGLSVKSPVAQQDTFTSSIKS